MKNNKNQNTNSDYSLNHVLYQKLGTDWYAFTEVNGDCYMSKVDPKEVKENKLDAGDASVFSQRKIPRAA